MNYKILVLDIDGTLTNSKKEISKPTLHSLLSIQEKGVKVVLASGRPTPGIQRLANELQLRRFGNYILSFNGAKIINCKTEEIIYQKTLPADRIADLYEDAKEYGLGILTYEKDCIITESSDSYIEIESRINQIPIKKVSDFKGYVSFPVNKCLMTGNPEQVAIVEQKLKEKYKGEINIFRSEPYFLELMPNGIDKAASLLELLNYLHLTKEQMICCGDGFNDITMLQFAGLGVAMENAQDAVKESSDYVTLSNDQDGIVHVIEKFLTKAS